MIRRTFVAHGRLAAREIRLRFARAAEAGAQVMTFEQLAARLAGGFTAPIDPESLRDAIRQVLPDTDVGELEAIKSLPGVVGAAADTLHKVWRSGIDLAARGHEHSRLAALAQLEAAALAVLPPAMLRPAEMVERALARLGHAPAILGPIEIVGISELSPCWRPLLGALADTVDVRWIAGPRAVPEWLRATRVKIVGGEAHRPDIEAASAASELHEVIEAIRWARELVASGEAQPWNVAIAATAPAAYDDAFLAARSDANLDIAFVHGAPVTWTREGQAAAALAEALLRGPSQPRLRRLATLATNPASPFARLPEGWQQVLPRDAPLANEAAWQRLLRSLRPEDWSGGTDAGDQLKRLVDLLLTGPSAAATAGEQFLAGASLRVWRKALLLGNPEALDGTIASMRQDDGLEPCTSIAFMPAAALAASPRPYVRLLGLTSSAWPRRISEDRLLPDHVVPSRDLEPLPLAAADRRDFETILATTERQVVLSRARRDQEGRLLGRSPLSRGLAPETYLRRNRIPPHAMSETDRLLARPQEFSSEARAALAMRCWTNWLSPAITENDGLVRDPHPALVAALDRQQSANSLSKLLRHPLGFAWRYALGLKAPDILDEPIVLDALASGNLLHEVLEQAVLILEPEGGLARAGEQAVRAALDAASRLVAERWETEQAVPPAVVWQRTLDDTRELAFQTLGCRGDPLPEQRSYAEVPFGGCGPKSASPIPWDASAPVPIPGTGFSITGYIDRLDVSGAGDAARVVDYKSGRVPREAIILNGGKELQRCLYAFAVKTLLGDHVHIEATLVYARAGEALVLHEPGDVLGRLSKHLASARANLVAGKAVPGTDAAGDYDDLCFALPANAANAYCKRKSEASAAALGDAAAVWEEP